MYINDVQITSADDGNFRERVSLQDGVNVLRIKAKNKMDKETLIERTVLGRASYSVPLAMNQGSTIEMKVVIGPNPAMIEVASDGQQSSPASVMLAGATATFYAKDYIEITSYNAGSTKIILNGKDIGTLGKEGETIQKKKFDKSSL